MIVKAARAGRALELRRRNGACFWQLFHDSEDPARFVETFMDESCVEHLR